MLKGVACFMGCHGSSCNAGSGVNIAAEVNGLFKRIIMISQFTGNTVNGNVCHTAFAKHFFRHITACHA